MPFALFLCHQPMYLTRKTLTQEEKAIVISTAVAQYVRKKQRFNDKHSAWANTARQEAISHE